MLKLIADHMGDRINVDLARLMRWRARALALVACLLLLACVEHFLGRLGFAGSWVAWLPGEASWIVALPTVALWLITLAFAVRKTAQGLMKWPSRSPSPPDPRQPIPTGGPEEAAWTAMGVTGFNKAIACLPAVLGCSWRCLIVDCRLRHLQNYPRKAFPIAGCNDATSYLKEVTPILTGYYACQDGYFSLRIEFSVVEGATRVYVLRPLSRRPMFQYWTGGRMLAAVVLSRAETPLLGRRGSNRKFSEGLPSASRQLDAAVNRTNAYCIIVCVKPTKSETNCVSRNVHGHVRGGIRNAFLAARDSF